MPSVALWASPIFGKVSQFPRWLQDHSIPPFDYSRSSLLIYFGVFSLFCFNLAKLPWMHKWKVVFCIILSSAIILQIVKSKLTGNRVACSEHGRNDTAFSQCTAVLVWSNNITWQMRKLWWKCAFRIRVR